MDFDYKYVVAILLIVGGLLLEYTGKATFEQSMLLVGAGLAVIGITIVYKSIKAKKLVF